MEQVPDSTEKIKFFTEYSHIWDEQYNKKNERSRIEALLAKCRFDPDEVVLEAGCGTGTISQSLVRRTSSGTIIAVDFTSSMIEQARRRHLPDSVQFKVCDVQDLPFQKEFFTSVLCFNAFPHFANKQRALNEFFRVLKPGGRLFIAHSMSREKVNALHQDVGGPIAHDELPHASHIHIMLHYSGFERLKIEDTSEFFYMEYRKPEPVPFVY